MSKQKKKLKDTAVGKFLSGAGSSIVDSLGDVLPDKGVFGLIKTLLKKIQYCHQKIKKRH